MSSFSNAGGRNSNNSLLVTPPSKRISLPASQRLSTIVEGNTGPGGASQLPSSHTSDDAGTTAPAAATARTPARTVFNFSLPSALQSKGLYNLPASRRYTHGEPPLHSAEKRPPSYSTDASFPGAGGEGGFAADPFRPDTQNPRWYERLRNRGGWRKILLIAVALVVVAIALGVGLGVGLSMRSSNSNSDAGSTGSPASPSQTAPSSTASGPFPIGTWSVDTFLTVSNSSCVSNAATWNCPPYTLYDASSAAARQASAVRFSWVVSSSSTPPSNLTLTLASVYDPLSSIAVPAMTPLRLEDEGTADERFTFGLVMQKKVFPRESITDDGSATLCYFNATTLGGSLYTRRAATLAPSPSDPGARNSSGSAAPWPGAVEVRQSVSGGDAGVPDCYRSTGSTVSGPAVAGLGANGAGTQCACEYQV